MISLTVLIIIVTVAVSMAAFNNPQLMQRLIMNAYMTIRRGQYYRMITSGFIHANWAHLGFNMFSFYFFGRVVEYIFGAIFPTGGGLIFLLFYLSAIIVSDLPVALKHKDRPGYNSLGASGGVSAVVFASILYNPLEKIYIFGIIGLPGFILGALYVIYSYYQGKKSGDGINHEAHLYGALYGLVFAILVYPPSVPQFFEEILRFSIF